MARQSIAEFVPEFVKLGDETAYVHRRGYRTQRWSYRQVAELAYRFARELDARQIATGSRVLLWGESGPEWVAVFLGCALRGVVVVPMDLIASPEFADRVAAEVDPALVVLSRGITTGGGVSGVPRLVLEELPESLAKHPSDCKRASEDRSTGRAGDRVYLGHNGGPQGALFFRTRTFCRILSRLRGRSKNTGNTSASFIHCAS